MSVYKPKRKLIFEIAKQFHSDTFERNELEIHWALFDELFMELGNRHDDLFRFFGVNLFHIAGQWCSQFTSFFYPALYSQSPFFSDQRIKKIMWNFFQIKLVPYSDLGITPLDEKQILRLFVKMSNIGDRNVLIGKAGSELLFFLTSISRMRRIIEVIRATRSRAIEGGISYLGANPEDYAGFEGLERFEKYGEIRKRYIHERNHYISRFIENWDQISKEMINVIHTILGRYCNEINITSTSMLLGAFLKEFVRCVIFAPIAKATLEEFEPEGVVVHNSGSTWENVIEHMAKAEGTTTYEIIDAAVSDHPYKINYADPETTASDYLIGSKGMERWLKKRGFPDDRLVLIGAPHYDDIPHKNRCRQEIKNANSRDGFDLLVIIQPPVHFFNINNYIIASEVIRACKGKNIRVHLKMKFASNRLLMQQLGEEVHSDNVVIAKSDLYITELLDKYHFDGVVSTSSNGMVEAVTMGVPVLWVSDAFKRLQFLVDYKSLGVPTTMQTLGKDLLRFVKNGKLRWESLQKAVDYVEKEGIFNNRGNCSNLVSEFILDKRYRKTRSVTHPPIMKEISTGKNAAAFTNFIDYYFSAGAEGEKEPFEELVNRYTMELLANSDEAMRRCSGYYLELSRILSTSYGYLGRDERTIHILKRLKGALRIDLITDNMMYMLADFHVKNDQPLEALELLRELEKRKEKADSARANLQYRMATVIMSNLDRLAEAVAKN